YDHLDETDQAEHDYEELENEFPSIYPAQQGVSPFALQAKKQWKRKSNDLRPVGWRGKVYGLVMHTTGGSLPGKSVAKGIYPTIGAIDVYFQSTGCHYINGWKGITGGDLVQVANEDKEAWGVGMGDQRKSVDSGRFEKDLPATVVSHWKKRWPAHKNSMELLPKTRAANSCYVHVECLPVVYHLNKKTVIDTANPPMRPGLRFTKAQHDSVAVLAYDIATRNGWPMDQQWWKTPRFLGHEDLAPINRHDKNGGWDPGGLRNDPYFDWEYVYQQIENIHKNGYQAVVSSPVKIAPELKNAIGSYSNLFQEESSIPEYAEESFSNSHYNNEDFNDEIETLYEDEDISGHEISNEETVDEAEDEESFETAEYQDEVENLSETAAILASGLTEYLDVSGVKGYSLKTGVFIPPGFTSTSHIDIILYLHGLWKDGYSKNGIERYLNEYSNLPVHFYSSRRNAILIAPLLGTNPQTSKHVFLYKNGFDNFISSCLTGLKAKNIIPTDAQPGRIIVAAHSAGGKPMSIILNSRSNELIKRIDECWGFDCLYGYDFDTWLKKDKVNNKLYHYYAFTSSGEITGPGKRGAKLQADNSANMFNTGPKEKIDHRNIIRYAWENEINKRAWFQPIAGQTGIENYMGISSLQALVCKSTVMPATFTKTSFSVSTEIAKGATESSYDFTRRMIRAIGEDPDMWYKNFTRTTFLGVSIEGPIHIEFANVLRKIETDFVSTISPFYRSICHVRDKLGITTDTFSGGRREPTAALKSMHLFGLALDVNMVGNPFVRNRAIKHNAGTRKEYIQPNGITTTNDVLINADNLLGGNTVKFAYGLTYDVYSAINSVLTRYLTLLNNDSLLQYAIDHTSSAEWKSIPLVKAKVKIQKDLDTLATALVRWTKREELKTKGFLNLSKTFVEGMQKGGLDWGGSRYGDMMHFDMRTTGVGKRIHDAIARS
ncbi:MAG TPA: N-acetylmuramoyl-L-alanine amidase, partial [Chitinophagaceae bacterium]|nr:N-acetylmuramoyl-L-alanine amidase [Chitinophagaceae bacterium]